MEELVSVIMPTYNCAGFIAESIESAIDQTYKNWELIIVDDCSQDNTKAIANKYSQKDNRVKYYCLEKNSGAAVARTKAMQLAKGDYIAFLDSDDLWLPEKLDKQIKFMKDNECFFTCTSYEKINEKGIFLGKRVNAIRKTSYNRLLLDCPVGNSTVMYDVRKMGKFKVPNIRKRNDDALWLKMLKVEPYIWGMKDVLMKYRLRNNSISSNKMQLIKYHWMLYRDIEKLSIVRSMLHIGYWCGIKVLRIK